jgi:xylan 1,4-beta-xylosidase
LNFFRMAGLMDGERVSVDGDALATRSEHEVSVLLWNYAEDDVEAPDSPVRLTIAGLPPGASRVQMRHYRIDRDHSNAYTVWKQMGSPRSPTLEQHARLEAAGQLQLLDSPRWLGTESGHVELSFALPRQAVSLVQVNW